MIKTASIIGSGNVASQYAITLKANGVAIETIFGRNLNGAQQLANRVGAVAIDICSLIKINSDLLLIAVSDDAYTEILPILNIGESTIVVHTSGSISMQIFEPFFQDFGVLYPLQTFSKERLVNMKQVPICIEASSPHIFEKLTILAHRISEDVRNIDSEQRKQLHIAAIFCSNYVNYLYSCASDIIKNSQISFDIFNALIRETAEKAIQLGPDKALTGPAKRGDVSVITSHQNSIENPELKDLYRLLARQILKKYNS